MATYTAQSVTTRPVYDKNSPYAKTAFFGNYLDIINLPPIPKLASDQLFTVNRTYQLRPDLLAFDLYGDSRLWWVFIQRNLDVLEDPIFDFVPGTKIYLPKSSSLSSILGL